MITVTQMLCIGRDCGLNTVYEAWSQVQSHWDAFFSFDKFEDEQRALNKEMFEKGLLEANTDPTTQGKYRWPDLDETLVSAMNRLGIEYTEPDWSQPEEGDGVL